MGRSDPRTVRAERVRPAPASAAGSASSSASSSAPGPAPSSAGGAPRARVGRYEILGVIGRGGMGEVFAARLLGKHGLRRVVALKKLAAPEGSLGAEARAAFLREARLSAAIDHPNVVPTLELGDEPGHLFLVMPLVRGTSLARLLEGIAPTGEPLPHHLGAFVAHEIAQGLHAVHELKRGKAGDVQEIVHRDVSPQNVLCALDGRVLVGDFGIAKLARAEKLTASGVVKGKLGYMAPEQARGEPLDRRADVFALGAVLWELLVGRALYADDAPSQTMLRIQQEPPPDPCALRPDIPEELGAITTRCLAKDPEERFATAGEVAAALRAVLGPQRAEAADELGRRVAEVAREDVERVDRWLEEPDGEPPASVREVAAEPAAREPPSPSEPSLARRRWVLAVGGVVALGVVLAWAFAGERERQTREAEGAPRAEASSVRPSDSSRADLVPTGLSVPSSIDPPPNAPGPTPAASPSSTSRPLRTPPVVLAPPLAPPASSNSAARPPGHKGTPFPSLDD